MDVRKEFKEILDEYGHYVLLQRTSRRLRCRCYIEINGEGDPKCPYCMGQGWVSKIERHKTRTDAATQIVSRPSLKMSSPAGSVWVDSKVFYLQHDVGIRVGDLIFEVGWDPKNPNKPTHLMRAYAINDTYDYRGDNGRIEYKIATSKGEVILSEVRNIVLRSLGPVKNYELVR